MTDSWLPRMKMGKPKMLFAIAEQNGAENLVYVDETGRLPGASVVSGGMNHAVPTTPILVKEV